MLGCSTSNVHHRTTNIIGLIYVAGKRVRCRNSLEVFKTQLLEMQMNGWRNLKVDVKRWLTKIEQYSCKPTAMKVKTNVEKSVVAGRYIYSYGHPNCWTLNRLDFEVFEDTDYSPDLSPSNHDMVAPFKVIYEVVNFPCVKMWWKRCINCARSSEHSLGVRKRLHCWIMAIYIGDYIQNDVLVYPLLLWKRIEKKNIFVLHRISVALLFIMFQGREIIWYCYGLPFT